MATADPNYVIAPWGTSECDTEVRTVELPSRELVVLLEVPTAVLERLTPLSDRRGIPLEQVLAERLEINRARMSILAAKSADDVIYAHKHLIDARNALSGVRELDTSEVEAEIERVWRTELETK